jgi:hypothetical protein
MGDAWLRAWAAPRVLLVGKWYQEADWGVAPNLPRSAGLAASSMGGWASDAVDRRGSPGLDGWSRHCPENCRWIAHRRMAQHIVSAATANLC